MAEHNRAGSVRRSGDAREGLRGGLVDGGLRDYMEKIITKEDRFLQTLTDKDLDRGIQPEWKERPHPLRNALLQVTFEQAHHLGELIALSWQQDMEPPEMIWIDVNLLMKGDAGPS